MAKNKAIRQQVIQTPARVCQILIKAYQLMLSPWLGHHCRFTPRCSDYALSAFEQYGAVYGIYLTGKRLLKCHPWHRGGVDLLPQKSTRKGKTDKNPSYYRET